MKYAGIVAIVALLLSGCETTNESRGGMLGAAAGGILGNQVGSGRGQTAATFAGMVVGGVAGSAIGASMDEVDRARLEQAQSDSLENGKIGETTGWSNPDTGNSGSVSPVRTYQNSAGQYCREFQQEIIVDGQTEQGFGTACRESDGNWRIIG